MLHTDDYYRPAHGLIHDAILELRSRNEPADPITVAGELTKRGELQRAGGAGYLHTLVNCVPTAANAEYYAEIVVERAILRRLIEAGTRIVGMAYAAEGDIDQILAAAVSEITAAAETRDREDDGFVAVADRMEATIDLVNEAGNRQGISGIPTGFADLDQLTNGLHPGQMIVVGARPGLGKSTLAMDFARAAAIANGRTTAFLSLEMDMVSELNMRILSAEARVALHHLRSGNMTDDDWTRVARRMPDVTAAPLYVNDTARTFPEIQAKIRRFKNRFPELGLVVIDYLQLIETGGSRRPETRQQEVSDISRKLKLLAKELQVPIVVLAQLNRASEYRADKRPGIAELRESGAIEQDADIIILIHREDEHDRESPRAGETDLIVGKHRNGSKATITVAAQLHYSRFADMTNAMG
jgi:replicative DNA helicase